MEVDSNASAAQSSSGAVPKVSSVTQPFVPQHNTQPFVPQTELKTPTVQNQSLSHSSMESK